jgi:predicted Rossmann fold nucleotide-binding protein DprA/Smf involved in DNA uptake
MASPLTDRQWLLFLTLLPDVGRKTLRHVLERQQVRRETPAEILRLPDETLREEYRLPPRALRALREERTARLEETARLDAHLTRCGVRWLSFQDAAYPAALEAMPEPPAVLFLYGNHALLDGLTVALLGSHAISAEGLQADKGTSLRFTSRRKTQNFTIYTQHTTPTLHHQRHQPQQQHTRAPTMPVP